MGLYFGLYRVTCSSDFGIDEQSSWVMTFLFCFPKLRLYLMFWSDGDGADLSSLNVRKTIKP